jgi:hypothetical protein
MASLPTELFSTGYAVNESCALETTLSISSLDNLQPKQQTHLRSDHSNCGPKHPRAEKCYDITNDDRAVEVKVVSERTLLDVLVMFENFPVWLLGLEPIRIRHIHILGYSTHQFFVEYLTHRSFPIDLVWRLLSRFGSRRVFYHQKWDSTADPVVTLVSGSLSYIKSVVLSSATSSRNTAIGVIDHHFYGRLRNGRPSGLPVGHDSGPCRWTRIRHESVGGASNFVALFCSTEVLDPVVSMLQRTLHHVLDHEIRPTCVRDTDPRRESALTLRERIHPAALDRFIVYSTQFCCTGWGIRVLTPGELAQVFGLPMFCRLGDLQPGDFTYLIPAHLLHATLDELCPTRLPAVTKGQVAKLAHPRLPLFKFPCASRSWIAGLRRWLPHSWIDARDDALVATEMWDKRLFLLYPKCSSSHLEPLRRWLLCHARRLVLRGLRGYLVRLYGPHWIKVLLESRQIYNKDKNHCLRGGGVKNPAPTSCPVGC